MAWQEVKWILLPLLIFLFVYVPWGSLIRLAKEEAKRPPKDVI